MKLESLIDAPRRKLLLLALCLPVLAGCFGAAAVGVGAGALVLTDRRPPETYITDQGIELRAGNRVEEKYRDKVHVNVTSYNRMLLLTGEAPSAEIKADIEKLASTVPGVKSISNELAIAGPSSLGGRSNDVYITSKVKARFVDSGQFSANHVKVVTEAGVVFLLGLVNDREAQAAVQVTRTTTGVRKVVNVMEVVAESETKRLDSSAANRSEAKPAATPAPMEAPAAR